MERSVILATGPMIREVPLPSAVGAGLGAGLTGAAPGRKEAQPGGGDRIKTITEIEKEHILTALEKCSWKLSGAGGAAKLLDINPSTLLSRMKKLGIKKAIPGSAR